MAEQHVTCSITNHIARITLNMPQAGNWLDLIMAQELSEVCEQINGNQDVYSVFLTGAGTVFSNGGDFLSADSGLKMVSPVESLASLDKPVVAILNGDAIGMGLELALACDLRIAANTGHFGLPQIIQGQIPANGGTQRLSRVIGKSASLEMILTGKILDAVTALEIGLVNRVVKTTELNSEADQLAASLAAKAPFALRYVKEAVNKGLDMPLEQGLRLEADLYFLLHSTTDRTEGIQSFLQKRQPKYRGN